MLKLRIVKIHCLSKLIALKAGKIEVSSNQLILSEFEFLTKVYSSSGSLATPAHDFLSLDGFSLTTNDVMNLGKGMFKIKVRLMYPMLATDLISADQC